MNSFNNKTPAYMYAKGFKLDKFLGNLQAYKIATGQVNKNELKNVSERFGSDEGAVFGTLITNASKSSKIEGKKRQSPARRRRRKRRKQNNGEGDEEHPDPSVSKSNSGSLPLTLDEPLTIPPALLAYKDCGSSDDGDNDSKNAQMDGYSSSTTNESDDSDEGETDFFGLNSNEKEIKSSKSKTSSETYGERSSRYTRAKEEKRQLNQTSYTENKPEMWDKTKLKYKEQISTLSTYKCWRCRRVGHLPQDCTVKTVSSTVGFARQQNEFLYSCSDTLQKPSEGPYDSSRLKEYYKRCHMLRESKDAKCSDCGVRSNLAYCFECGLILCDGRGHLIDHLMEYPSHTKLYSYKLQRQIKCCKSTCEVMDATQLLMCSSCLDRMFTSHYSMINATWSRTGLKALPNTLACEQHFHWHRMNCANPTGEVLVTREKLENSRARGDGLLSEFYF